MTALALATLLALAPAPGSTPASAAPAEKAPEAPALAQADPEAAPSAEADPEAVAILEAALAKLDPAAREAFEAMNDMDRQELFEKAGRGAPLAEQEQAILEAFGRASAERFEAELRFETGDIDIGDGLAVLHLGDELRYLGPEQAERILVEAWGNPPGQRTLGMIFPADVSPLDPELGWGVVITYTADGHVEDDDADDIDYDELLAQMKQDVVAENPSRRAQGYPPIRLVGWAEAPRYDEANHRLYWAKELEFDGSSDHTLNYAIRVLGRRGVLELNAIATLPQLPQVKPAMEEVLARVDFVAGNRYDDFDPDLDQVAAYGIGGLIAGKVLAKAGILAVLLKLLLAGKKLFLVGAIAIGVAVKAWFGRKNAG